MALIKCPECGKDVSSTCDACPHCGYKLKNTNTNKKSFINDHASMVYERNQRHKWIMELIAACFVALFGIGFLILSGVFYSDYELRIIFTIFGIILLAISIVGVIYYIYRLKTY